MITRIERSMESYSAEEWFKIFGYVGKLAWIYSDEPYEIDVPYDYQVPRGHRLTIYENEEQQRYFAYEIQRRGRRNPVSIVSSFLIQWLHENDENLAFFLVELFEAELLLSQNHVVPILLQTGSFLQHALEDHLNEEDNLSPLIRAASDKGELKEQEVKMTQFIRHCRNDVAHNFAYYPEWDYRTHDHAATCVPTLLNSITNSWWDVEFGISQRLTPDQCVRIIEGEFRMQWIPEVPTYDSDSMREKYVRSRGEKS